jgi:integrase
MARAKVERENFGLVMASFPDRLRVEAIKAQESLAPFGKTISDAVAFYRTHLEQTAKSRPVAEVVHDLLNARKADGVSKRYHKDLRNRLTRFADSFGTRLISEITVPEIEKWLRCLCVSALTRNSYRLRLSALFEFAAAQGWVAKNSIALVAKAKTPSGKIGILKPTELAMLLEQASQDTLPYWAIGAFAGLRSAELERLEWQDIHFDSGLVEVTAAKAKTAARRFVAIQKPLSEWLKAYQGKSGKVCPAGLRKKLEADRTRAGLSKWPSNALRHSFASYHLAHFCDGAKLALEMGHRDQKLIFANYRELVKPKEAAKFWNIMPAPDAVIAMAA